MPASEGLRKTSERVRTAARSAADRWTFFWIGRPTRRTHDRITQQFAYDVGVLMEIAESAYREQRAAGSEEPTTRRTVGPSSE